MIARLSLLLAVALASAALAQAPYRVGAIEVTQPWVSATPNAALTAVAYATIVNRGAVPDRLISASSLVARSVELHEMSMAGGVMRMRAMGGGAAIGAGKTLVLSPGGEHLMLIGPTRPLRAGEKVPLTLTFAHAGRVNVEFDVR
jgi:copper(I)-binding protein